MKPLSEILQELGIAFTFPIEIKDSNENVTYYENSYGFWCKYEYDTDGNETYFENSYGDWYKKEYDAKGRETYFEDSNGYWRTKYAGIFGGTGNTAKYEYDANGQRAYCENGNGFKHGTPRSAKTCEGKVIEIDGTKYELKAL